MGNHERVTAPEIPTTTTAAMAEASCFIAKSSLPIHRALRVPASEGACGWDQIPSEACFPTRLSNLKRDRNRGGYDLKN